MASHRYFVVQGSSQHTWSPAVGDDGTFKSVDELRSLYESKAVIADKEVIAYCRIGERGSHTWYVL